MSSFLIFTLLVWDVFGFFYAKGIKSYTDRMQKEW